MSENSKKQTRTLLAVIMVISVIITAVLLTESIECEYCEGKITGKYYLTLFDDVLCKDCGKKYYRGFPGDIDSFSSRVDNTTRDIVVVIEVIGFVVAMICVGQTKGTTMPYGYGYAPMSGTHPPFPGDGTYRGGPMSGGHMTEYMPVGGSAPVSPVRAGTDVPSREPAPAEVCRLRTTFKPSSSVSTDYELSYKTDDTAFDSRFESAGDL